MIRASIGAERVARHNRSPARECWDCGGLLSESVRTARSPQGRHRFDSTNGFCARKWMKRVCATSRYIHRGARIPERAARHNRSPARECWVDSRDQRESGRTAQSPKGDTIMRATFCPTRAFCVVPERTPKFLGGTFSQHSRAGLRLCRPSGCEGGASAPRLDSCFDLSSRAEPRIRGPRQAPILRLLGWRSGGVEGPAVRPKWKGVGAPEPALSLPKGSRPCFGR